MKGSVEISIILPIYSNEKSLMPRMDRIENVMTLNQFTYEILLTDDASTDSSWSCIKNLVNTKCCLRGFRFLDNKRQHTAVLFGLTKALGKFCVALDADLQDPPEVISLLFKKLMSSRADIIFAGRIGHYQTRFRMLTSMIYRYLILEKLYLFPKGAGLFFIITRAGIERLLALPIPDKPSIIGLIIVAKLRKLSLPIQRSKRVYGYTGYTTKTRFSLVWRLLKYTWYDKLNNKKNLTQWLHSIHVITCFYSE